VVKGNDARDIGLQDLPEQALIQPLVAETRARAALVSTSSAADRTYALQALGIVARERGAITTAIRLLRRGLLESDRARLPERRAELLASLGNALSLAGRHREALERFSEALGLVRGAAAARVLVRRCFVYETAGEHEMAYGDARRAAELLRRAGDSLWEARARNNSGGILLGLGRLGEADRQYERAQSLAEETGQDYVAALVIHSRADCAYRRGDLPQALALLHTANLRYNSLGVIPLELLRDRLLVLLAARLVPEAVAAGTELVEAAALDRSAAGTRAESMVLCATAYLDVDAVEARSLARRAALAYRRQDHVPGEQHARLVETRARAKIERPSIRLARVALWVADGLRDRYATERLDALLLAGSLCAAAGLVGEARECWNAAGQSRRRGSALRRSSGWLATARLAQLENDRSRILRACDAGLDVLENHRRSLGSTELQARATEHGRELAGVAIREVLRSGTGRELLRWTERWRATVLNAAPGQHTKDPDDLRDLSTLRALTLHQDVDGSVETDRTRAQVEERIRQRAHARAGRSEPTGAPASVDAIVSSLDEDTALVAIARVDGIAHVVVARNGRVRRFQAGGGDEIDEAAEFARFALRSAATGNEATATAMTAALEEQAGRLEELLLGPAGRALGDGPVVMVPPARLQSIPWDALPALRDRPIAVSPSASAWLRSCQATRPRRRRVALVTGPRLESAGAEIPELAQAYENPTVLGDGAATCDATMKALDGAWLAHVAAHGTIRTDNPMFSALELDDGPLTVYDLERLRRAPYRLVLSVCESAVGAPTGADELLGLSSALIGLGTAGLLASIVQVNDQATVPFSLVIHERLRAGDDLATALMHARRVAGDDPVARATAYSFLALGAA
jgi:CHAT domain-containing protein